MRTFFSYGPVDCRHHFCVPRKKLIEKCSNQLIGVPEERGHFFTIWAPRQCGKTWLMRQVKKEIEEKYPDQFAIVTMSMQGISLEESDPPEDFFSRVPLLFRRFFKVDIEKPGTWEEFADIFSDIFEKPLILFIDEFDKLPPLVIDKFVTMFRDIYLDKENFNLHGLALIGVRAVLGVDSLRGSPFNIQRSLHVPNFTIDEVVELFEQYQNESGQIIDPEVVQTVYDTTRGQPGLVCWFGELLTEKYNTETQKNIDISAWEDVYRAALYREWNNTVLNLIKKAKGKYKDKIVELFTNSDQPFTIDSEWCSYAYLNGIIDFETINDTHGKKNEICRFSSPFIQMRLYNALTGDLFGERLPILPLDPLDTLSDVFEEEEGGDSSYINIPALLQRYKDYLKRFKAKGINPWKDQPRRSDLQYTEYVGHFHLYFWLQNAVGRLCTVSPEFPTGNGRVDLHLKCKNKKGIIEVKSFKDQAEMQHSKKQAVKYAKKLNYKSTTLTIFVPLEDEDVLLKLSGQDQIDGIMLNVVAIGWV
ncbi:conserved hypothetical protein [Desulfamplus magnetovallimortis]|uniref:ATPase domain protein, prokaryote domain protein n=1 Tax=Desulfamplus magnetovallimortis TaxID=1246637 RepID=A0A1W1HJL7_9BACT|nr:AAA-like domain-containing protein [Desulfamplus magnetovallimortis]SLM32558.1 conserved hypothetical protein [Desulfamplus magnetovallimortis]